MTEPVLAANGDLAWLLAAFVLIALMFPGLALFYGGMVGAKNTLNMMMMVLSSLAVASVLYVIYGYGLVSGPSVGGRGFVGNPAQYLGLIGFETDDGSGSAQGAWTAAWFILFAAITVAIVASGAAGRMKFTSWLVFSAAWLTLVYFPIAHWVFAPDTETGSGGFLLNDMKIHDYAGGTAVHINSGVAALALALVLGRRKVGSNRPHNVPSVVLGAGILWFGWFGFNGSCALGANFLAQYVVLNTLLAGSAGMIGFGVIERIKDGHVTTLGLVTGIIAGLVGITPSANAVTPIGALAVGVITSAVVATCLGIKNRLRVDDSLDAFAVHGIGGITGTLCVALFASAATPAGISGVLVGGGVSLLWRELAGIGIVCAYSFVLTWVIAKLLDKLMGLRVDDETERSGLDSTVHAESAYEIPTATVGHPGGSSLQRAVAATDPVAQAR
ncbi:ammonium transporter [Mycobacterium kyogaense]|uniref:ammonium transporter n=1 Tax=Mycobacterium kyogaense TaxID=2212479 RepID=UPI001F093673|nr:ammonium transporter [Mycobacterium kyogaense]